jgi:hypothetical protein
MSNEPEAIPEEEKDPSPYIRTFAKDFAALAAQNPELAAEANSTHKHKKQKEQKIVAAAPLAVPERPKENLSELDTEAAALDARTREGVLSIPTKESNEDHIQTVDLPEIAPGDIISQVSEAEPEPFTPAPTLAPMSPIAPVASIAPLTENQPSDKERAEILARLKAKVQESRPDIVLAAPIVIEVPEPVISTPPPPPVTLAPVQQIETPSPIHTYKTDFNDHVEKKQASTFSILAAEKDAPNKSIAVRPARRNGNKALVIVSGILLVLVGVGGMYAAYVYMSKNAPVLISTGPASLIPADSQIKLAGTGSELMRALASTAQQPLPANSVLLTYVDFSTTTSQGVTETQASGGAFLTALNLTAPDILIRNIDPSSMVGIVHANTQTAPFFILRVTSYERTFAGMLQWEPTMYASLSTLYPTYPNPPAQTQTNTSTTSAKIAASSTPAKIFIPVIDSTAPAQQFIDEVVANRTARALKDKAGRTLVLYGYADKQTLIIARDEAAFALLLGRLNASGN